MAVPPPSPLSIADAKASLRRRLRAERSAFVAAMTPDALAEATRAIAARLARLIDGDGIVGGYVAHRGEPDVAPALLAAHAAGRPVALPRVDAGGAMRFARWHPGAALAAGFGGIPEPGPGDEIVPDLLLVPLIGFDAAGRRLGQGAGCYDRWLAVHPGTRTIGVAWSAQRLDAVPAGPWDVPLDRIVTEAETIAP